MISYRQKDDPYNAVVGGFVTGGLLSIRGGASVACKQAMMGGMILLIIEGVSQVFSAVAMRKQHQMMQEQQQIELARMKAMMQRGGENPWQVDYDSSLAKGNDSVDSERADLADNAKRDGEVAKEGGFMSRFGFGGSQ